MRILIYRIGQLGDTLIAVPALKAIRLSFPTAKIYMLCDAHHDSNFVLASDVLSGSGLIDEFIAYDGDSESSPRLGRIAVSFSLVESNQAAKIRSFGLSGSVVQTICCKGSR